MNIYVRSRYDVLKNQLPGPCMVISITNSQDEEAVISDKENQKAILRLKFDDIGSPQKDLVLFNEGHAEQILAFVNEWKKEVKVIVVHCEAGISRSAGVAVALALFLGEDDTPYYAPPLYPNSHVKSTIMRAIMKAE